MLLDDDRQLNDIQETIFRECWQGRQSYEEIATLHQYDPEYIKSTGAKLWQYLSQVFGEKVKKSNLHSVIKRYLRKQHIIFNRNVEVNLNGANSRGYNINVEHTINHLSQTNLCHPDTQELNKIDEYSQRETALENNQYLGKEIEKKITEILLKAGVIFFANPNLPLNLSEKKPPYQLNFVICYGGKLGMMVINLEKLPSQETPNNQSDHLLLNSGICLVKIMIIRDVMKKAIA